MTWNGEKRKAELPRNWKTIRARILRRDDYRCRWLTGHGGACGQPATDVDHVVRGDDHGDANLRALCRWHHARKSSAEGNAAQGPRRSSRLPAEPHPLDR